MNILELADLIMTKPLHISTNLGYVDTTPEGDWTYCDKFGGIVSTLVLKHGVSNDLAKKIIVLHGCMEAYSMNCGGVTII
jgi:hypothetical protein